MKNIRVKGPLRDNAQKIVEFRVQEFLQWRHALADGSQISDLHNLRIAAKRLRYALEIFDVCFAVKPALNKLTAIQEAVGDIHDLDVLTDIIRAKLSSLDADVEQQAVAIAEREKSSLQRGNQLRRLLYGQARDRRRLGLVGLLADFVNRRQKLYGDFQHGWGGPALDDFAAEILEIIGLTPVPQDGAASESVEPAPAVPEPQPAEPREDERSFAQSLPRNDDTPAPIR